MAKGDLQELAERRAVHHEKYAAKAKTGQCSKCLRPTKIGETITWTFTGFTFHVRCFPLDPVKKGAKSVSEGELLRGPE